MVHNSGKLFHKIIMPSLFSLIALLLFIAGSAGEARAGNLSRVRPNLKPLDLSRPPSTEELMAAGQLGGQLYPTADIVVDDPKFPRHAGKTKAEASRLLTVADRDQWINLSFGKAIQEWNSHRYAEAVVLFNRHVVDFPDSPWAAEALLHLGCDAFYHGRSSEAEAYFLNIIERNRNNRHEGGAIMTNKARLRLAVLKAARNNTREAMELFATLARESGDWRDRTYASQWLRRLSAVKKSGTGPLACGAQALSRFFDVSGLDEEKAGLDTLRPGSGKGFSFNDLAGLAAERGVKLAALRLTPGDLGKLELPALVHVAGVEPGDSGHYWVLEELDGDLLTLFDPQGGRYYTQTIAEFAREWSGAVLVHEDADTPLPGARLASLEMKDIAGGCCGVPKPESDLGNRDMGFKFTLFLGRIWKPFADWGDRHRDPDVKKCQDEGGTWRGYGWDGHGPGSGCDNQRSVAGVRGAPGWMINPLNMNLFVQDIPLWHKPAIGPPVEISLSYNSQSAIAQHEPFGAKWQFNYGSYLVVDTGGEVTIFMADGRRDVYSPNPSGGYLFPYQVHNTLVKLAGNSFELRYPDGRVDVYTIPAGTSSQQPFLTESRDAYGNKLTFTYDSQIHLTTITDAGGGQTTLTYNGEGLVTRVTDPFGRHADFEYGVDRTLTRITDMGGYSYSFSYDDAINLTSLGNSGGTWQFYIEPAEGVNNSADSYPPPGGVMWENYRITVTNPLGGKEEFYYNGYSGSGWHIQPRDYISYYPGYDGSATPKTGISFSSTTGQRAEISSVNTPAGRYYSYVHDVNGDLLTNWDSTRLAYNSQGRITSVVDPRLNVTTKNYAPNGFDLLSETNGLGTISYAYNAQHDITSVTDRMNHATTHAYNSLGQRISAINPLGAVTSYEYDLNHRLTSIKIAGVTTESFTYDPFGRIRAHTGGNGVTLTYDYNLLDDVTTVTYPDGTFETKTYSGVIPHLVIAETDRAGKTTTYNHDKLNRLIGLTRPDGSATTFDRDANGNVTAITDANGNITRITYDLDDRPVKENYPDGTTLTRIFQTAGLIESITKPDGGWVQLSFDEAFNLISRTGSADSVNYVYDDYNRPVSMNDFRGQTTYTYDAASRLTSINGPDGSSSITLFHDNAGHRTGLTVNGRSITYAYDVLGRVTGVGEGGKSHVFSYSAAKPLPDSITRPSGSVTTIQRDSLYRTQQVDNKKSTNDLINRFAYTYAPGRNLPAGETVTGGILPPAAPGAVQVYGYDSMNQPVSGTTPVRNYAWNQNGNLTTGYTIDGYPFTATYDGFDRLSTLEYTDSGGVARRTGYAYDGDGWLLSVMETADGETVREAKFVRLGPLLLQERDGAGAVVRDYTWSNPGSGGEELLGLRQGGVDYEYLLDGRGRVAALTGANQAVVAAYAYGPLGIPSSSGSIKQPFRSSVTEYDEQTGLFQFSSRFYLPNPGVMISRQLNTQPVSSPVGADFRPLRALEMRPAAPFFSYQSGRSGSVVE